MPVLLARVRDSLRSAADLLARRTARGQLADWLQPLIGRASRPAGTVDLLAVDDLEDAVRSPRETTLGQPLSLVPALPSNAPKCLLVTTQLDFGGLAEVVGQLALELPRHGVRTAVLGVRSPNAGAGLSGGRIATLLRAAGIELFEADENAVQSRITELAPDVISAHGAPVTVYTAAERAGVPFVDNLHGMYSVYGAEWRWHRAAVGCDTLAAVVVVSNLLRDDYLRESPGFPPERVVAVPNGVSPQTRMSGNRMAVRARLGLTDEFLFVSLARYSLEKNAFGLVAAFGEMAAGRPEAHLVLAGHVQDARYFNRVVKLRDSLPCAGRIYLRAHTTTPRALLAAADGFVLNSFHEGGPISSMEALCAGLPVVLSDMGSAREQVGDDPARGYTVANPLGAPLPVSWEMVSAARFRPQANRSEFAVRMDALVVGRLRYADARDHLAQESRRRFSSDLCVARHAQILTAAARSQPIPATAPAS